MSAIPSALALGASAEALATGEGVRSKRGYWVRIYDLSQETLLRSLLSQLGQNCDAKKVRNTHSIRIFRDTPVTFSQFSLLSIMRTDPFTPTVLITDRTDLSRARGYYRAVLSN